MDPRGLLWSWEPPDPHAQYVIGVDPTHGVIGWSRQLSTVDDSKTDNGVIEVIKVGKPGEPDAQVAEFAAPVTATVLARYANVIGRLYCGRDEEGMATMLVEKTGPGLATIEELMRRYKYTNQFMWKQYGGGTIHRTPHYGWESSPDSNRLLFMRSLEHIHNKRIIVRSPWLVEEFRDCTSNWILGNLRAKWGAHDDRVRAFFLGIWCGHDWTTAADQYEPQAARERPLNPVALPVSAEEMMTGWDEGPGREGCTGFDDFAASLYPDS